jgi:hypothetical protein
MTLPSSGQISFSQLASEYAGSSTNIRLSDYYYSGTYLKSNDCTNYIKNNNQTSHPGYNLHFKNIPSSASNISMSVFRGKAYYYARQTIDNLNGTDVSIEASSRENESPKSNFENGAYYVARTNGNIIASSTGQAAIRFLLGNRSTTTVYFQNDHRISGKGGDGGRGQNGGSNGQFGGSAVRFWHHAIFNNNGVARGGGGGGGGGGHKRISYREGYCSTGDTNYSISGSGGGGGAGGGSGGSHGTATGCNFCGNGGNGGNGNYNDNNAYGNGGSGCGYNNVIGTVCSYEGGRGGDWGERGQNGAAGTSGGSGGNAVRYTSGKYYRRIGGGGTPGGEVAL